MYLHRLGGAIWISCRNSIENSSVLNSSTRPPVRHHRNGQRFVLKTAAQITDQLYQYRITGGEGDADVEFRVELVAAVGPLLASKAFKQPVQPGEISPRPSLSGQPADWYLEAPADLVQMFGAVTS
jgi:hypothetical protein